jgi:hypothetical protein
MCGRHRCSIAQPDAQRRIGFFAVEGVGVHRIWYAGGRWACLSALPDSYTDYILLIVDLANRGAPRLVSHRNGSPPFGGGTHSALPLPERGLLIVADEAMLDEQADGLKLAWVFDIREPTHPVSFATLPTPDEADYRAKGGHFGPHNLHKNRPGSFVSSTLVFAAYQNAGIRVFDIGNPYQPRETGAFVPAPPQRLFDRRSGRPRVIQSADVVVDAKGLVYATDYNAGLSIIEYEG